LYFKKKMHVNYEFFFTIKKMNNIKKIAQIFLF
jgi:hypothetical protein